MQESAGEISGVEIITVLIIDDQPIFRAGLRHMLSAMHPGLEIVGEASNGEDGLRLVEELSPAVVLLNAEVEGLDGLEAIRELKRRVSNISVIVMTNRDDEEKLFYAIKYGAAAYVLKTMDVAELGQVIRRAAGGEYLINDSVLAKPVLASKVLKSFRDLAEEHDQVAEPLYIPLSSREVQVLDYIAKGNSNKEIARAMTISDQTVKNHITSIMRKLAVNDRTQAVVYAMRQGWIKG
ncbi:MAG TPA: response regulator transcription factor [Chloroflexota bacterium]|nr:response regulator transcription factor [Chloroflexota bacterium]